MLFSHDSKNSQYSTWYNSSSLEWKNKEAVKSGRTDIGNMCIYPRLQVWCWYVLYECRRLGSRLPRIVDRGRCCVDGQDADHGYEADTNKTEDRQKTETEDRRVQWSYHDALVYTSYSITIWVLIWKGVKTCTCGSSMLPIYWCTWLLVAGCSRISISLCMQVHAFIPWFVRPRVILLVLFHTWYE